MCECVPLVCEKEDERHITVSNLFHYNVNMINTWLTCIVHIENWLLSSMCVRFHVVVLVSRFALTIANERRTGNLLRNVIWFRLVFSFFSKKTLMLFCSSVFAYECVCLCMCCEVILGTSLNR